MSYYNLPIYCPPIEPIYQISTSIANSYFRQYIVMVDLLLYEKIQRNGWSPYATPFYPGIRNFDINDTFNNNTSTKETKEPDKKDDIIT